MELKCYDAVVSQMAEVLKSHGLAQSETDFRNETKSIKIAYDEEKSLCILSAAELTGGEPGEYAALSSWLLDASSSENDAKSIVLDFTESVEKMLGIRKSRGVSEIKLPAKAAAGETPNATSLCQKVLAIFPQFKDTYRAHVSEYGGFLPITFFKATVVPELRNLLISGNPKQLEKVFAMLSAMYAEGDREVGNLVCGVIILGAIGNDQALYEKALSHIDSPYLKPAVESLFARAGKDKKLKTVLG